MASQFMKEEETAFLTRMAHNPTVTRKSKSTRIESHPSNSQQVADIESPKEKIPKIAISQRRGKTTSQPLLQAPTKMTVTDLHRLGGACQMMNPTKTQARAVGGGGGGGAPATQKYHREQPSYKPPPAKTTRSTATTTTVHKLTPKETKGVGEQTDFKDFKTSKEYKEFKEARAFKEARTCKEAKDPQAKPAAKSQLQSHRTRHQSDRTKTYFDKYLKFAFDLSTPEGVKQLEAHFFPDKDTSGAGTSNAQQN